MLDYTLLFAVLFGVALLLFLILYIRIQAFLALLIVSITVGMLAGLEPSAILTSIQSGMSSTLGFVATVVGLGALFGAMLEHSGGAQSLAHYMIKKLGDENATWAMVLTGFLVAIPVFFDVALIIIVPMAYALQRQSGKSLMLYGIPLIAGLAITHTFIPPTPGPIAVADILGTGLGWVIMIGFIVGIPAAIISGPILAKYLAKKIHITAPEEQAQIDESQPLPNAILILTIIAIPIVLILVTTVINGPLPESITIPDSIKKWSQITGHPFTALIIGNLLAWYMLGIRRGVSRNDLLDISSKSFAPAGIIILLTGAGGAFKQMLIDTGTGEMLADSMASWDVSLLLFAFILAAIVRVMQGSATVAMITAAGIVAPLMEPAGLDQIEKAMAVIAIASGATVLSHVNDSGFWLVSRYLRLTENQTLKSWTVMTTIIGLIGIITILILHSLYILLVK